MYKLLLNWCVLLYIIMIFLAIYPQVSSYLSRQKALQKISFNDSFSDVDKIIITFDSKLIEVSYDDYNFINIKNTLNPFNDG